AAVAPRPRVGDGDAVLGIADFAKPRELDLHSHGYAIFSCMCTLQFSNLGRMPRSGFASRVCLAEHRLKRHSRATDSRLLCQDAIVQRKSTPIPGSSAAPATVTPSTRPLAWEQPG